MKTKPAGGTEHTPYPRDPHEREPFCRTCTEYFGVGVKWRSTCEGTAK